MSYIRSKMVGRWGPYSYKVESVREGKRVRQIFVRYLGKVSRLTPEQHCECIKDTRSLADSLRGYKLRRIENAIKELNTELQKWKEIETTTEDNSQLDEAQKQVPRLERQLKTLAKKSIEAYRQEYQRLASKCPGFDLTYHENALRLRYLDGGFDSTSWVVKDDAKQLYDELLEGESRQNKRERPVRWKRVKDGGVRTPRRRKKIYTKNTFF